ncbi:MAG: elongation factor Ts [Gammaproteobacteria bacterium]|nr:elongation factor Ts [Gammaproteobacteria bacterium]
MSSELDLLKQLREITGAGMMDCKKYLQKSNNNLDEAIKLMRSEEGIKADKKSARVAAEGVVFFHTVENKSILIEINSETDFVARSDDFIVYVKECCEMILGIDCDDYDSLMKSEDKKAVDSLEEHRKSAIAKLGENIVIRRFRKFYSNDGSVTGYTHNNKIGSVAVLEKEDNSLGKDICMQIVASNPLALDETSIDQATLASEKEIYKSELDKLDKKEDIKRNILEGKMKKFIVENTLLDQPFIKDSALSLRKILKNNAIKSFLRFQLGEGLEKKSDDFAKEVYSQIK